MLNRRDVLQKCVVLGSVSIASRFSAKEMLAAFQEHETQHRKPTPPNTLPITDVLLAPRDDGVPLTISRQVFDTRGDAVSDAIIEIWQTNHQVTYDLDGYRAQPLGTTSR
jgi:protocatechuate 3,4-dioxygenase beta subunit